MSCTPNFLDLLILIAMGLKSIKTYLRPQWRISFIFFNLFFYFLFFAETFFLFIVTIQNVKFDSNYSGWVCRFHEINHLSPTYLFSYSIHAEGTTCHVIYKWINISPYLKDADIHSRVGNFFHIIHKTDSCSILALGFCSPWQQSMGRNPHLLISPCMYDFNP